MRPALGLLVLLGLAQNGVCSLNAAPWEAIYMYISYYADYMAHGNDPNTRIFVGLSLCGSPQAPRLCRFDEFLRRAYLLNSPMREFLRYHSAFDPLDNNRYATIEEAARQMKAWGWRPIPNVSGFSFLADKMFGSIWARANSPPQVPGQRPKGARYYAVMEKCTDALQTAARAQAPNAVQLRALGRDAMHGIRKERLVDCMPFDLSVTTPAVKGQLPSGVQVRMQTTTTALGNTYDNYDQSSMMADIQRKVPPANFEPTLANIRGALYGARQNDPDLQSHWSNIDRTKHEWGRVAGTNLNC